MKIVLKQHDKIKQLLAQKISKILINYEAKIKDKVVKNLKNNAQKLN
jgi:predicted component of type VI protein secretion system